MYKNKESDNFCVVTELKLALHHLEHAKGALGKGEPKRVEHHMAEAADDISCVIDYIRGHHHGRESAMEVLREFLPELKELLSETAEHKVDNPRIYRGYR